MIIDFVAKTRSRLIEPENVVRIEDIIRALSRDFLGPTLYESSNVDEGAPLEARTRVDVQSRGWLLPMLHARMEASSTYIEQSIAPFMKCAFGLQPTSVQCGSLHFVTEDAVPEDECKGKEVFFDASERALVKRVDDMAFDNRLAVNWLDAGHRGSTLADLCLLVMQGIFDNDIFDYGYCCLSDQYRAKNIDYTGGGMRAVGLDVSKYLPGFYWGNFFGSFLCDRIGHASLRSIPGCSVLPAGRGFIVMNELPPDAWATFDFIGNERAALDHIGRKMFFERGHSTTDMLFTDNGGH